MAFSDRQVALLLLIVLLCSLYGVGALCPARSPKCRCTDSEIFCERLGDVTYLPSFTFSTTLYYWMYIQHDTLLPRIRNDSFQGIKVKHLTLKNLGIQEVEANAFRSLWQLYYLDMSSNNLKTVPLAALKILPNLKRLILSGNYIKTLTPRNFEGLVLETLHFERNYLSVVSPSAFSGVHRSISHLYMSYNSIRFASAFTNLENLTTLDLDNNVISSIERGDFLGMERLQYLRLYSNKIASIDNTTLKSLRNLKYLTLNQNFLNNTLLTSGALRHLSSLRDLQLHGNKITGIAAGSFRNLGNLTKLVLSNNQIAQMGDQGFSDLTSLQTLVLSGNQLRHTPGNAFHGLKNLQFLYLDGNQIESVCEKTFTFLVLLKRLQLHGNQLEHVFYRDISTLVLLEYLSIHGNPLSCDCWLSWLRHSPVGMTTRTTSTPCSQPAVYRKYSVVGYPTEVSCQPYIDPPANMTDDACQSHTTTLNTTSNLTSPVTTPSTGQPANLTSIQLKIHSGKSWLFVQWDVYTKAGVHGFVLTYRAVNGEGGRTRKRLPALAASVTRYNITHLPPGVSYVICLEVLVGDGATVLHTNCIESATPSQNTRLPTTKSTPISYDLLRTISIILGAALALLLIILICVVGKATCRSRGPMKMSSEGSDASSSNVVSKTRGLLTVNFRRSNWMMGMDKGTGTATESERNLTMESAGAESMPSTIS